LGATQNQPTVIDLTMRLLHRVLSAALGAAFTTANPGSLVGIVAVLTPLSASQAIEVNGQTSFVAVPTKARLINGRWYAFEGGAELYLVMELPSAAQAGLGGISLAQIRGVQPAFYHGPIRPTAFLGTPRREGAAVPVNASFGDEARSIEIRFPEPVLPGSTITVAFRIGTNPPADLYSFAVSATPYGPNPISQSVGVVTMNILEPGR
jgi:hypothetical protein